MSGRGRGEEGGGRGRRGEGEGEGKQKRERRDGGVQGRREVGVAGDDRGSIIDLEVRSRESVSCEEAR